jgi:hypothetical protein
MTVLARAVPGNRIGITGEDARSRRIGPGRLQAGVQPQQLAGPGTLQDTPHGRARPGQLQAAARRSPPVPVECLGRLDSCSDRQ